MCRACETKAAQRARKTVQQLQVGAGEYPSLTRRGFIPVVPMSQIKNIMDEGEYQQFRTWMRGQTQLPEGVFPWDLERFLRGLDPID